MVKYQHPNIRVTFILAQEKEAKTKAYRVEWHNHNVIFIPFIPLYLSGLKIKSTISNQTFFCDLENFKTLNVLWSHKNACSSNVPLLTHALLFKHITGLIIIDV